MTVVFKQGFSPCFFFALRRHVANRSLAAPPGVSHIDNVR